MASAQQLIGLIKSHAEGDEDRFFDLAMQLAAAEAQKGHKRLAEQLRQWAEASKTPPNRTNSSKPIPLAAPRGDLAGLMSASYPTTRLSDVILSPHLADELVHVVVETRMTEQLESKGLRPRRRLLLAGPPGTGKTLTAAALAGELKYPLFTALLHGLITKFMGETAQKLRIVFDAVRTTRGVYLFDEIDALAAARGAENDVGEARRILNSFLQFLDEDTGPSIVVATTNLPQILDRAIALALAVRRLAGVRALAAPTVTADYFDAMEIEEQAEWLGALQGLTTFQAIDDPTYITLLDRGVSRAHPLIAPALNVADRHAADPAWGVEDSVGHGTQLAGLSLYGDLTIALQTMMPIQMRHRLESAKIIPDAGHNPHHLLGAMTRAGINAAETVADRRRTFAMASTTEDDTPHDGAPTSWSSEIDQLIAGTSGLKKIPRLFLVSAGNANQNLFGNDDYLSTSHHPDNEIESPAHAWNAICVGAYTDKVVLPAGEPGVALAPSGDLAPSSRTASWLSHWPIKPDVVFEGGNWVVNGAPPPMGHSALALLTTDHQFPTRTFTTCGETSGATALGARAITELWSDYRHLWPETIRAIFVSSARWTQQMRSHLPATPAKGDFGRLFQRYGYGVPDMERARRSASNALTLVVQDSITPYRKSDKPSAEHVHNEMKLFELPWPVEELRKLTNTPVTLRVALSTFIRPNPSEPARGSKFRYASHNLRFKLNRPNEGKPEFIARISKIAEQPDGPVVDEDDGWIFGRNRRDVGSIQIDELTCQASDLARRNILAVHPVAGWWKTKTMEDPEKQSARFALVVEIDAGTIESNLYAEVKTAIDNLNIVATSV